MDAETREAVEMLLGAARETYHDAVREAVEGRGDARDDSLVRADGLLRAGMYLMNRGEDADPVVMLRLVDDDTCHIDVTLEGGECHGI